MELCETCIWRAGVVFGKAAIRERGREDMLHDIALWLAV